MQKNTMNVNAQECKIKVRSLCNMEIHPWYRPQAYSHADLEVFLWLKRVASNCNVLN